MNEGERKQSEKSLKVVLSIFHTLPLWTFIVGFIVFHCIVSFLVVPQTINALTGSASGTGTNEADETKRFIMESTLSAINEMISTVDVGNNPGQQLLSAESQVRDIDRILMPPPPSSTASVEESDLKNSKELLQLNLGLSKAVDQGNRSMEKLELENLDGELDLRGIDDKEIEAYLMTEEEAKRKKDIWERLNADYIEQQKGIH